MEEREQRRGMRHQSEKILKEAAKKYKKHLGRFYQDEENKASVSNHLGLLVDIGTPHSFALLLKPDGSLQYIQYGWTPKPDEEIKLSDLDYILLARHTMENPPKSPTWLEKP